MTDTPPNARDALAEKLLAAWDARPPVSPLLPDDEVLAGAARIALDTLVTDPPLLVRFAIECGALAQVPRVGLATDDGTVVQSMTRNEQPADTLPLYVLRAPGTEPKETP